MATKETMTVHKALSEAKIIDSRIAEAISSGLYCTSKKHSAKKVQGLDIEAVKQKMQGSYDRVIDLISRANAIRKAIAFSNAVTKVTICGESMTVTEAIYLKNHGAEFAERLLESLKCQYSSAVRTCEGNNGNILEERADSYVRAMFDKSEIKNLSEEAERLRIQFLENNSYEILDEIKIEDKIRKIEDGINNFISEVDSALSVSNALTEITVEY